MPPAISQFFRKLGSGMQAFSPAQRTLAILGVAVIVLGGVALTAWLGKPAYSPLFSGLKDTDANSIVEQPARTTSLTSSATAGPPSWSPRTRCTTSA